ncbi:hypothetical protein ACLB1E_23440 [Escherichia coli]
MSAQVSDTGTYASSPQVVIGGAGEYNFPGCYTALSGWVITGSFSVALSVFLYALSNEEIRHENQSGERYQKRTLS